VQSIVASGGEILGIRPLDLDGLVPQSEVRSYYGDSFMTKRAEHIFVHGSPPPPFERRQVASPLTDEMLRPFASPSGVVQFASPLSDGDYVRGLRISSGEIRRSGCAHSVLAIPDHRPRVPALTFPNSTSSGPTRCFISLESLDGLRHLPTTLQSLGIGDTKRKLDLSVLARFDDLQSLFLEGQTKGISVVSGADVVRGADAPVDHAP
jgi:hypothetical protein